jgi:hypothetical protein
MRSQPLVRESGLREEDRKAYIPHFCDVCRRFSTPLHSPSIHRFENIVQLRNWEEKEREEYIFCACHYFHIVSLQCGLPKALRRRVNGRISLSAFNKMLQSGGFACGRTRQRRLVWWVST